MAGCSLLYQLTRLGWNDVVLVEKDELTSGSTWHAAGLCQRERGLERELACLVVDAADADPHGYEPILDDRERIGYVASGGYGHTVEKTIALAYLPTAFVEPGTELVVQILGERRAARVVEQPLYDPENQRLLS